MFILASAVVLGASVAAAAVAVLALRVQGMSMSPTLADGERILIAPGTSRTAERDDIVVLTQPGTATTIVKRVAAVAGDRVQLESGWTEVPAGKVYVLGDNPDGSEDSRDFGWADVDAIKGRVWLRVWPLAQTGAVE